MLQGSSRVHGLAGGLAVALRLVREYQKKIGKPIMAAHLCLVVNSSLYIVHTATSGIRKRVTRDTFCRFQEDKMKSVALLQALKLAHYPEE